MDSQRLSPPGSDLTLLGQVLSAKGAPRGAREEASRQRPKPERGQSCSVKDLPGSRAEKSVTSLQWEDCCPPAAQSKSGESEQVAVPAGRGMAPQHSLQARPKGKDVEQQGPHIPLASALSSLHSLMHKTVVLTFAPKTEEEQGTQER